MSKLRRIYDDDSQYYFITTKTFCNKKIFNDNKKMVLFLECINFLVKRKYFTLYAWVILSDHVHLLMEIIGSKNVSEVMHDLKSYSANRISKLTLQQQYRRGFHASPELKLSRSVEASAMEKKYFKIWQTSFYDHIIRDETDLKNHYNYIQFNPVKHGYVNNPEDWPWSSYHTFLK